MFSKAPSSDLLIKDSDKEMTEAETDAKNSEAEHENMMNDSAAKHTTGSKALFQKDPSDLLITDSDKEMTETATEEKNMQATSETMMIDSAAKYTTEKVKDAKFKVKESKYLDKVC